ncbi:MAG: methyl-accepting chemotaxis protein [Janthinobacterium lividum]
MPRRPTSLDNLRESASRGLIVLLWVHVPFNATVALAVGNPWLPQVVLGVLMAGTATACWLRTGSSLLTRLAVAVALMGMAALIVAALAGHLWQLDGHMYFFVGLATLAAYCDWRALLMAAAATTLHHLMLNYVMPQAVYPGGSDLPRVLLHGTVVMLETAMLSWLTCQLVSLFAVAAASADAADAAREATERAHAEQAALRLRVEADRRAGALLLAARLEADVGGLVLEAESAAFEVDGTARALAEAAAEAMSRTGTLAEASGQTATGMQAVTVAVEELSASVRQITGHMARAAVVADHATEEAGRTDRMVQHLADSAARIGEVVGLVRGIAAQTNLLALNATIEAARAGDAGKGFSVVAGEVKVLAAQTARATDEIGAHVRAIQAETTNAVAAIGGIAATIGELGGLTASVAAAVEQQEAITREIGRSAQHAAAGTRSVTATLDALADSTGRTGTAASVGQVAAGRLSRQCGAVSDAVRGFMEAMRAA